MLDDLILKVRRLQQRQRPQQQIRRNLSRAPKTEVRQKRNTIDTQTRTHTQKHYV
jgi:hypothetical protein